MKIAIITGATSGMGREMAIALSEQFGQLDEIWALGRRRERLIELKSLCKVPVRALEADLTKESDLLILEEMLQTERPQVMFLVNAAGYGMIGPVGSLSLAQETGMVRLNCEAVCAVTNLVLPYLCAHSRIFFFASAASFLPQPDFAIYAATKAFVLSYARALREELKPRAIKVTAICPGPVRTEFFDIAERTGKIPLYKLLVMADAKKVVRKALRDGIAGEDLSVYGVSMNAFRVAAKCLPHKLLLAGMGALTQRRKNG